MHINRISLDHTQMIIKFFFFQAEDGIRDRNVTGVQTCALPILNSWSSRPDGSVDFINQRFLEFTGRSMEDILGRGWESLVHPDDLARYVGGWQAAVATGEPMENEARVRRADGDYRWLLIRNVPLRDELDNIAKWYGTSVDIEERHRAEEALRR